MEDLKLIFIIEEVRKKIRGVTVEVSRILKKDSQILIRRNRHDFDMLSNALRREDLPLLDSLRTYGLMATPYEISADSFLKYPFSDYSKKTNQFYIRRRRCGGVKLASKFDIDRIVMPINVVNHGVLDGCDLISRIGSRGLECTIFFRYFGCVRRLPFAFSSVPLNNEDGILFVRDKVKEDALVNELVSHGIDISIDGAFSLTYERFDEISNVLSNRFQFLTAKNQTVKSYSSSRSSSGLKWFGDITDLASTDVIDAYLAGRRYVVVGDSIVVVNREEVKNAAKNAVEKNVCEESNAGQSLCRFINDLRQLDILPKIIEDCTWLPSKTVVRASLKTYQIAGVRWIRALKKLGMGGILADEMGLGKTVQLLGACAEDMLLSQKPSIIIAPASVVENWMSEIRRFTPALAERIVLTPEDIEGNCLCLLSYEKARRHSVALQRKHFSHMIVDEGQKIKNAETISYHTLVGFSADFRMVLTGTPIENNIQELWNHVGFIDPSTIGCFKELCQRYPSSLESIKRRNKISLMLLAPFVLARKKKDVLKNLPTMKEEIVFCTMGADQKRLYEKIRRSFLSALKRGKSVAVPSLALEALLRLRECCCHPAILPFELNSHCLSESTKFKWVFDFIGKCKDKGEKVLIFSQFVTILEKLKVQIEGQGVACYCLTGATNKRQKVIDDFNADTRSSVFLCSIKAGGFGINLTTSNQVILMDPWWNPAVEQQAFARAHRIGQKRNVHVYKLICKQTVEEKVLELQEMKRELSEGLEMSKLKVSEMITLLEA